MAILPLQPARVPNLLTTGLVTQNIDSTQEQLLQVENQVSTGKQYSVPSQNPTAAAVVIQLQQSLAQNSVYSGNASQMSNQLGETDNVLSSLTTLLTQATSIASADANSSVNASQRTADAQVIQSIYTQALSLANQQYNGVYLFGGDKNTTQPFVTVGNGVQFVGGTNILQNQVDADLSLSYQVSGSAVFGSSNATVNGATDLAPELTTQTRLMDLKGADGNGIQPGPIQISNGTITKTVDLTNANDIGDVVNAINSAAIGNITASVGANGNLVLSSVGDNITVNNVGGGTTASDLGILQTTGAGAGVPVTGTSLQPQVTPLTPLAALRGGHGIDTAGITLANGGKTATVPLTSPPLPAQPNVQDLLNAINGSGVNVDAQINADGTGINITNPTQGSAMTITENGGTTGAELGVLTFSGSTTLASLNGGKGVASNSTGPDFTITRTDGTSFNVTIGNATTIQDVINEINSADTSGGTQPARVVASLSPNGDGIQLTDQSGGAGNLTVTPVNGSEAAADLGLTGTGATATATTINGANTSSLTPSGIFTDLANLRDALTNNDIGGITAAGQSLTADQNNVIDVRGQAGAVSQELTSKQTEITNENLSTNTLMSSLQDTDMATAITKLQQLQITYQASLQVAAQTLSHSLLNYLG